MPKLPFGDIGPCEVWFGYDYPSEGMPIVITPYLGKVTLRITDAVTDIHEEGKGVAPIDSFFEGTIVELEIPMTRSTLDQLALTIGYQLMGSLAGNVLTLDNIAGVEMYKVAHTIVIKPLCNNVADDNPNHWIVLNKCHPYRDIELGFDRSGQRIHLVKFKVFPARESGYEGAYLQEGMEGEAADFVVTSFNKYIDIKKWADAEGDWTATLTEGGYTGAELATHIAAKLNMMGGTNYNFTVDYAASKFTIAGLYMFYILWKTGIHGSNNANNNCGTLIGFNYGVDSDACTPGPPCSYISDFEVPP